MVFTVLYSTSAEAQSKKNNSKFVFISTSAAIPVPSMFMERFLVECLTTKSKMITT